MDYCDKGDMHKLLEERKRLPEAEAREIFTQLAAGLHYLSSRNLVHRDLKPQNILVTSGGSIKIADFGFARHTEELAMMETQCGSPLYMAPEVLAHNKYDAKADLWSVGIILYQMLFGFTPFNGKNPLNLLDNIKTTKLQFPSAVPLTPQCQSLIRGLLRVEPLMRCSFDDFFAHPWFNDIDFGALDASMHNATATTGTLISSALFTSTGGDGRAPPPAPRVTGPGVGKTDVTLPPPIIDVRNRSASEPPKPDDRNRSRSSSDPVAPQSIPFATSTPGGPTSLSPGLRKVADEKGIPAHAALSSTPPTNAYSSVSLLGGKSGLTGGDSDGDFVVITKTPEISSVLPSTHLASSVKPLPPPSNGGVDTYARVSPSPDDKSSPPANTAIDMSMVSKIDQMLLYLDKVSKSASEVAALGQRREDQGLDLEALALYTKCLSLFEHGITVGDDVMRNTGYSKDLLSLLSVSRERFTTHLQKAERIFNRRGDSTRRTVCAEKLIYDAALSVAREGAAKEVLGEDGEAKKLYVWSKLLLESLTLEEKPLNDRDTQIINSYVSLIAERVVELDGAMVDVGTRSNVVY